MTEENNNDNNDNEYYIVKLQLALTEDSVLITDYITDDLLYIARDKDVQKIVKQYNMQFHTPIYCIAIVDENSKLVLGEQLNDLDEQEEG